MLPLISVIIPTYNRADVLPNALRSVLSQQGRGVHFEIDIVVVDDASTDGTAEVVRQRPGVYYLRFPFNRGASAARNAGVRLSRGRYVAFLDDDDEWLPDKLVRQLRALEAHPEAAVVYSPYIIRFAGGGERPSADEDAPSGLIFQPLLRRGNYCGAPISALLRRAAFYAIGGFDEELPTGEDYDMWLRLAFRHPFAFLPGAVAIRKRKPDGKYGRYLLADREGCSARYVVERRILERALALLPGDEATPAVELETYASLEVRIGAALSEYGEFDLMRAHLLGAFRRTPRLMCYGLARSSIARTWRRFAQTVDEPIPTTRAFCDEVTRAARGPGTRHWAQTRRLVGGIWREVGSYLASAGRHKEAAYAAGAALLHNPLSLGRRPLVGLIAQAGVGMVRQTWTRPVPN